MNWIVFAVLAWVAIGLELGLRPALAFGDTAVAPSFILPLLVYVALNAHPKHARWAALLLGLLLDLTWPVTLVGAQAVVLAGPYALGCLLAAQLVILLRGVVIAKNPLTLVLLTLLAGLVLHVFVVAALTLRTLPLPWLGDDLAWRPASQLLARAGIVGYTAAVAFPISLVLFALQPAFGFQPTQQRRFG